VLHGHDPTNGPKGLHEQQALPESELLALCCESVRSLIPRSQSAPQADVCAGMLEYCIEKCGIRATLGLFQQQKTDLINFLTLAAK
jgi:hypothetical protein